MMQHLQLQDSARNQLRHKAARESILLLLFLTALAFSSILARAIDLNSFEERRDIFAAAQAIACESAAEPDPYLYWRNKIFDYSPKLRRFKNKSKSNALDYARRNNMRGYVAGSCDGGSKWQLATYSTAPMKIQTKPYRITLNLQKLVQICPRMRAVHIAASSGLPSTISSFTEFKKARKRLTINPQYLKDGLLFVECGSKNKTIDSKYLYWMPTLAGPSRQVPHQKTIERPMNSEKAIMTWINQVRSSESKHPLEFVLLSQKRKKVNPKVKAAEKVLIEAKNLTELAWWIWNIPHNRKAILSKKLQLAVVEVKQNPKTLRLRLKIHLH
jgi:hypothetical protein